VWVETALAGSSAAISVRRLVGEAMSRKARRGLVMSGRLASDDVRDGVVGDGEGVQVLAVDHRDARARRCGRFADWLDQAAIVRDVQFAAELHVPAVCR
jgi:hypothetical protein